MSKNTVKQSKFLQNKKSTAIALFLMFAIAVSLVALPSAIAQSTGQKKTYAFIGALPNPAGVGEEVLLHIGIPAPLESVEQGWEGLSVTITKPDGTTDTISGIRTDVTGGTGRIYVPTMAGNYTLQTHFPEQVAKFDVPRAGIPVGTTMLASDSDILTLVVQEQPTPHYPGVPLPTEYWTRPIDAQAREWSSISGNWLSEATYTFEVPYNDDAPETPHILWTKQLVMGGLAGGSSGPHGFEDGDAYEPLWGSGGQGTDGPVIIGGVLYYNQYKANGGTNVEQEVVAVDLHTGEELWVRNWNNTRLAFGQTLFWDSFNYHAVFPYLWSVTGSTWNAYNPTTGRWEYSMTNVPPAFRNLRGPNGEIYRYTIDAANGWMTLWNSSRVPMAVGFTGGSWGSTVLGQTLDASHGIEWNKTIPTGLPLTPFAIYDVWYNLNDRIISSNTNLGFNQLQKVTSWAISVKPGQEGQLLFKKTWTVPLANVSVGMPFVSFKDGVFVLSIKETRQYYGFSLDTGEQLWGPTEPQYYTDQYQILYPPTGFSAGFTVIVEGKLISAGNSGIVYAYDVKTGERLWTYEAVDPYNEILWGNNWPMRTMFVADGKIYLAHDEHSPIDPKPRGAPFICLNVTTGEEIWRADGLFRNTQWGAHAIIGDSIMATMDTYDERIYAIGKGPSATTVSAPDIGVPLGKSVLVKGLVTDISPGTEDYALTARFPNGVPAVADDSISEWMLYVYKQFPRPTNATGVEVIVSVFDPNNNVYEVGRTTSDSSGFFTMSFTPAVPGEYTIVASFDGSGAYFGSFAKTAINVEEAPAATPEPTPTPASVADQYFLPMSIGTIVAIIVVLALLVLILIRKK